jgi:HK97 family phage major capsid protein
MAEEIQGTTVAPLAALVNGVLEKREKALVDDIARQISTLAETPDRSVLDEITPEDGSPKDERIISRTQPVDGLYRGLHRTSPEYEKARTPDQDHWNATWLRAVKDGDRPQMALARTMSDEAYCRANLLEGILDTTSPTAVTLGSGSGLLPQSYANVIEIGKLATGVLKPLCQNFQATGGTLRVPCIGAVQAVTASEGAAVAEANPAVTSVMMILTKLGARIILSDELLSDSAFNVMQAAGARVGQAIGLLEDTQILTTDGNTPNITGALVGGAITETSTTELVVADIGKLFFSLGKAYQQNATWLGGTVVCTLLTGLTDGNGRQVLQTWPNAHGPVTDVSMPNSIGTIFGRPVYHVPAVAGDLILGDLNSYGVATKGGIEVKVSNDVGFTSDTVQFKFTERMDGQMLDAAGIKEMQDLATLS